MVSRERRAREAAERAQESAERAREAAEQAKEAAEQALAQERKKGEEERARLLAVIERLTSQPDSQQEGNSEQVIC